jgi:hypothetical protein
MEEVMNSKVLPLLFIFIIPDIAMLEPLNFTEQDSTYQLQEPDRHICML